MTDFTGKRTSLALACLLALGPLSVHAQSNKDFAASETAAGEGVSAMNVADGSLAGFIERRGS
jgi:hypothetical protein